MSNIEKINTRNEHGVKYSTDTYRTIKGKHYQHWTDGATKEECEKESPNEKFIVRNDSVYRLVN